MHSAFLAFFYFLWPIWPCRGLNKSFSSSTESVMSSCNESVSRVSRLIPLWIYEHVKSAFQKIHNIFMKGKKEFPAQMEIEEDFCEWLSFAMICILSWERVESWKCTEPNEDGEVLTDMKTKIVSGGKVNGGMTRTTPLVAHLQIMLQILGRNVRAQSGHAMGQYINLPQTSPESRGNLPKCLG